MGRSIDYSSPQHQGQKVPQVHRLGPFVMLTLYPKSAACSMARHKHFPESFQGVVTPLHLHSPNKHLHPRRRSLLSNSTQLSALVQSERCWVCAFPQDTYSCIFVNFVKKNHTCTFKLRIKSRPSLSLKKKQKTKKMFFFLSQGTYNQYTSTGEVIRHVVEVKSQMLIKYP